MFSVASLIGVWLVSVALATSFEPNGTVYSPCPLLGAYYPPPKITKASNSVKDFAKNFTVTLDRLIQNKGSAEFGPITPNTTSFSVVLFSGDNATDPAFFEYYYTAPNSGSRENLTAATKIPVGDLTMVFTVYAWLVKMGDHWDEPISTFLPELKGGAIPWESITVGALAGQLSGLPRGCFVEEMTHATPIFLPDTTPVVSYAAFQLLAFALQGRSKSAAEDGFSETLESTVLGPLHLSDTHLLGQNRSGIFRADSLNLTQVGEPAALSLASSSRDLARTGNSILSAHLISEASTRRWLHSTIDTSNLRNGVGRPWEVYRAGKSPISPILDLLTKSGSLGPYASYFGLSTDFNVGFAILAHDASVASGQLDLNAYADVVSETVDLIWAIAAEQTAAKFAGEYRGPGGSLIVLNITSNGPGLEVQRFQNQGSDVKTTIAKQLGIAPSDLDFRLYPTNVRSATEYQFAAVFQDKSAPVDAGTPTCITWEELGATAGVAFRYVFSLDSQGGAISISAGLNDTMTKV